MINLPANHLDMVKKILSHHVPHCTVLAFGSRVTGTAKQFSDLDLAISANAALPFDTIASLRDSFSESDLPIKVDVVDLHKVSPEFQQVIMQKHEVLQGPPEGRSTDTDSKQSRN